MKLTYQQALDLHAGLNALESREGFQYGEPNTPYRIASTIRRLESVPKAVAKARRQIHKAVFGDKPVRDGDPRSGEFLDKLEEFMDSPLPEEVKVLTVKRDEIKAKENGIAGSVLAKIAVMIVDFDDEFKDQGV